MNDKMRLPCTAIASVLKELEKRGYLTRLELAIGASLAIFALVACYSVPAYRPGILGVAFVLVMATFYFFFYSRNHLIAQAPEEAAALTKQK